MHRKLSRVLAVCALASALAVGLVTSASATPKAPSPFSKRVTILVPNAPAHPSFKLVSAASIRILVQSGDTLSSISKKVCGHSGRWPSLWWNNRKMIHNPNAIQTGWALLPPDCDPVDPHIVTRALAAIPAPVVVRVVSAPTSIAPAAIPAAAPAAPAVPATVTDYSAGGSFQQCVIQRESGGNASAVNASSGAGGLYGFLPSTWQSLGYSGLPEDASVSEQNAAFAREYAQAGTAPWAPSDGC